MEEIEYAILELLIFPEGFESIVEECRVKAGRHVIGDVLKQLLHDEYVGPFLKNEQGDFERSLGYDSDFLDGYYFQITSKGLKALESQA
ncbi:MAG: hypothetical protein JJ975_17785 [Bacteroidia bacterium]|nr:hypothetical protein [Bacteroidia bacterium]